MDNQTIPNVRVLLCDDDLQILCLLETILGRYTVETAKTGHEALEKLPLFAPDLILLDVSMPVK